MLTIPKRLLSATDTATSPSVAVISESLAERLFGSASPLGKHLTLDKPRLLRLAGGDLSPEGIEVDGDLDILRRLIDVLDQGDPSFDIVVP